MTIPAPVAATVADVLADRYTHPELNLLFMEAGAPGDPPAGTKLVKCQEWLRRIRDDAPADALSILGRLLERFMEEVLPSEEEIAAHPAWAGEHWAVDRKRKRDRVRAALANAGLAYVRGGIITRGGAHVAARQLHDLIRGRNLPAIEAEFEALAQRAVSHPRDALHQAANIVEAVLGEIVMAWKLTAPARRTLNTLWATVKPALNADPAAMPDPDLAKVAGAMAAMVDGLQGLRDDKSRAHAMRPDLARNYRIEPRHARLVVNAALALTVFLIEAWDTAEARRRA